MRGGGRVALSVILASAILMGPSVEASKKKRHLPKRKPAAVQKKKAPPKPKPPPTLGPEAPSTPVPLDQLISTLKKKGKKKPSLATASALNRATALLENGKSADALKISTRYENDPVFSDHALWISGKALEAQALAGKSPGSNAARASANYKKIVYQYPYSPLLRFATQGIGHSLLLEGASLCDQKKQKECLSVMNDGLERLSLSSKLGQIEAPLIETYVKSCALHPDELCRAWVTRLAQTYPGRPEYKILSQYAEKFLQDLPPPASSARLTRTYHGQDADLVAFDTALLQIREQKWGAAAKSLRQFLDDFPRSGTRFRARFWLAYSVSQEKKSDEARQLYQQLIHDTPLSYFGMMSALLTSQLPDAGIQRTAPLASQRDPHLSPVALYRVARAEKLLAAQAYSLASIELRDIRSTDGLSNPFLLYLAALQSEAGNHSAAFSILGELIARGYEGAQTETVLRLIFPTPFFAPIEQIARESNLDPILVLSLVKQESAFDREALSSTGARGLMQLMPATFNEVAPEATREEMAKAEQNLRAGTKYLAKLITRYNGNTLYALAAYNAGMGNVDRWLRGVNGKRNMAEAIEIIPYRETREYVASIIRNYYWYTRRIRNETMSLATLGLFFHGPGFPTLSASPTAAPQVEPEAPASPEPSASPEVFGPHPTEPSPTVTSPETLESGA